MLKTTLLGCWRKERKFAPTLLLLCGIENTADAVGVQFGLPATWLQDGTDKLDNAVLSKQMTPCLKRADLQLLW